MAVLVIEGVSSCPEDEGLAVQHVVLPHHDLHEGLAPTEVQEGPPAITQSSCLLLGVLLLVVFLVFELTQCSTCKVLDQLDTRCC